MKKNLTIIFALIILCAAPSLTFCQSLSHNVEGRHVLTAGGYFNYLRPANQGKWLAPFLAYQRNVRLDRYRADKNSLLLQLGTSFSPTNTLDDNLDSSNYVLSLPGYVNPFLSLYTVQAVGKAGFTFHANTSTGFKLLPFNKITTRVGNDSAKATNRLYVADNTFIQYYFGLGAGISFRRFVDLNVQYNRIYHDLFDETREKFRAKYPTGFFHGSYFDVSLRVHPYTTPDTIRNTVFSFFAEFEWRGLGRSYQHNKSVAFGIGVILIPGKFTKNERDMNEIEDEYIKSIESITDADARKAKITATNNKILELEKKLTSSVSDQGVKYDIMKAKNTLQEIKKQHNNK